MTISTLHCHFCLCHNKWFYYKDDCDCKKYISCVLHNYKNYELKCLRELMGKTYDKSLNSSKFEASDTKSEMACMHAGHISAAKIIYDMSKIQIASIKDNRSYNFLDSPACIATVTAGGLSRTGTCTVLPRSSAKMTIPRPYPLCTGPSKSSAYVRTILVGLPRI